MIEDVGGVPVIFAFPVHGRLSGSNGHPSHGAAVLNVLVLGIGPQKDGWMDRWKEGRKEGKLERRAGQRTLEDARAQRAPPGNMMCDCRTNKARKKGFLACSHCFPHSKQEPSRNQDRTKSGNHAAYIMELLVIHSPSTHSDTEDRRYARVHPATLQGLLVPALGQIILSDKALFQGSHVHVRCIPAEDVPEHSIVLPSWIEQYAAGVQKVSIQTISVDSDRKSG